ncbi:MAG: haloacid dehalogenase-like hydrolase [Candidatus Latescibacterota bacterium]
MRGAALFDLDGTLLAGSTERRVLAHLRRQGALGWPQAAAALRWMVSHPYSRVELTVRNKAIWRGIAEADLGRAAAEVFAGKVEALVAAPLRQLIEEHRAAGRALVLLSGAPEPILGVFAWELRFDIARGTVLEACPACGPGGERRVLTGRISGLHPYGPAKRRVWLDLAAACGLAPEETFAYADRAADRYLLEAVGYPVAVSPDRGLARLARRRGWPILRPQEAR